MAERLDLVLLGATGFTGKHCIPYIHELSQSEGRNLTWGVAGRSEEKLKQVLESAAKEIKADLKEIPVFVVDIKDESSLRKMARRAKVVINCCGPYHFLGEAVVKACIAEGAHHVDISAEPQFMERMQLEQNEAAKEKGVYVVSACGFDSIPCDLAIAYFQQQFKGTLNSMETYLETWEEGSVWPGPINYGTWESMVYMLAYASELKVLRRKLFPNPLPAFEPKLKTKFLPHKSNLVKGWVLPYLGPDHSIVERSQRHFYEVDQKRPVQAATYFVVKPFFLVIVLGIFLFTLFFLARFEFGRKLLLKYPSLFTFGIISQEPPSEERVKRSWFQTTFYGEGWKEKLENRDDQYAKPCDRCIVARVKGQNPGYGTTCVALVLSAIMVATESDKMPGRGGVYPPGAAFAKTSLIKQLNGKGVTFDVVSQKDL